MAANYDFLQKFVIVGSHKCGKSSLLKRFAEDRFQQNTDETIGVEFASRTLTIKNKEIKLQVWDTAGQERFRSITRSYYRGAHAFILCFDVTDRASFEKLSDYLNDATTSCGANDNPPMLIVACKCDLVAVEVVSADEALDFATRNGCGFVGCSAKLGENVDLVFETLARTNLEAGFGGSRPAVPVPVPNPIQKKKFRQRGFFPTVEEMFRR